MQPSAHASVGIVWDTDCDIVMGKCAAHSSLACT
jgi:hypothetical protein